MTTLINAPTEVELLKVLAEAMTARGYTAKVENGSYPASITVDGWQINLKQGRYIMGEGRLYFGNVWGRNMRERMWIVIKRGSTNNGPARFIDVDRFEKKLKEYIKYETERRRIVEEEKKARQAREIERDRKRERILKWTEANRPILEEYHRISGRYGSAYEVDGDIQLEIVLKVTLDQLKQIIDIVK